MNEEQNRACTFVKDGHNVYIGGCAGTGKSFLVTEIVSWAMSTNRQAALTCTTGVACCLYPQMYHPMTVHKWSGLGDGRLTAQQLNRLIDASDDHYVAAAERMKNVDILIIDEISMLSKCMFDKLEAVMRHVRGSSQVFGGAQLVVVGDFLQLPPVRNSRYNDPGEFSFQSEVFPLHRIFLSQVMRQKDEQLIKVVHNLAIGQVDQETTAYVKHLSRPLTLAGRETTRLFSVNILADIYNRDCLMRVNGDVYQFEAIDEGEERHLNTLTVMLLRNLSDQLVNGLCGTVVDVREGEVDVHFLTLGKTTTLTRMNFAVFDPASNRNLAVRNQVPLKLCYAITVHKAQGMTLDRAEVDCRQMFQSGQLAVAMGRVKSPDGLRVVNFTQDAVIPQPSLVLDFLNSQWIPAEVDRSCCHIRAVGFVFNPLNFPRCWQKLFSMASELTIAGLDFT
ncbi:PIF1-like protein [Mya arenaria]|uniref:ATP-dependent DNA helicase n=1 Tax=Mya arenaria TaxID=6604 RepID=A0ABY7EJF9_MYAAR|nr:PIF1-like protein [Mya arenaria]